MLGIGGEGFAHHHAGLGQEVGVLHGGDAGDDGSVAGQLLIDEVEGVGAAVDVRPAPADGVGAVGDRCAARRADVADVVLSPGRR